MYYREVRFVIYIPSDSAIERVAESIPGTNCAWASFEDRVAVKFSLRSTSKSSAMRMIKACLDNEEVPAGNVTATGVEV